MPRARAPVQPIQQSAVAECGLACAAMLLNWNGRPVNLQQLRATHDFSIRGSTLRDILAVLRDYGLDARPLRLEVEDLAKVSLPCLLHWSFDHFVVLERVDTNGALVIDPASGKRRVSRQELGEKFTGVALEVTGQTEDVPITANSAALRLRDILPKIRSLTPILAKVLVLTLVLNVGALLLPLFVKYAIDRSPAHTSLSIFLPLASAFLALALLQGLNQLMRGRALISLRKSLSKHMAHSVFGKLVWLNHSVVERRSAGAIAANYRSIFALSDTLGEDVVSALIDAVASVVVIGIVFYYDLVIGLVTTLSIAGFALWTAIRNRGAKVRMAEVLAQEGREAGFFVETINRLQAIRLFQAEAWRKRGFSTVHQRVEEAREEYARWNNASRSIGEAVLQGSWIALVALMAVRLNATGLNAGLFSALIVWISLATTRARDAVMRFSQIDWLESHVDRLSDIVLSPTDQVVGEAGRASATPDQIGCVNIAVRYAPNLPRVLEEINLHVAQGEWLTIIGSSGEGKTTLAKALTGLLPLEQGHLTIDGKPIDGNAAGLLRAHIGAVMQNDGLLAGSLRNNITFFDETPDLDLIDRCISAADLHDDIARMPMGLDSVVGEQGAGLSAGQGQRLMLARALYKQPRFLILDEFTANVDEECERRIIRNIRNLNLGVLAIAHRSNVIEAADRVLVLCGTRLLGREGESEQLQLRAG